ncbi:DNA polymerase theta [Plutella xylostella]|uniref:DNA polymerase theta n=1 Tax=Plutella xylostella TaxID=51655 RepID=UPI00203243D0|nr:DNA polymerase theta [Plutella xylostella]
MDKHDNVIDSQFVAENVGFLDSCFDNTFALQASLIAVKEYTAEDLNESKLRKKTNLSVQNKTLLDTSMCKINQTLLPATAKETSRELKCWGLPAEIARKYEGRGITEMFEWQVSCLGNPKVLLDCCNLVYSAPTSAGKTLVAEILTIKTILERQKKVIIILPFVSIVREKMFYLQDILSSSGIRVEGFMGSQSPPGGLQAVHVAICTIEKANSLVNRLLEDGSITDLGAIIVDELHLLGDPHRGYILELLLTKVKYVSSQLEEANIQIVGMSATLPNLEVLARWLDAELFVTQFRPIPLDEYCLVGNKYYDKDGNEIKAPQDSESSFGNDQVLKICFDTIKDDCSVLIFCMTKARCESLAQNVASSFFKIGCSGNDMAKIMRNQLKSDSILEVLEQLKSCPVGLDNVLKNTISFGVAYHHAGLTFDERDIIEGAFKTGAIRVLVATSTLSSGVNLPARKVIIRTPVFQRQPMNILTYKQMIGRAGRMGKDVKGESILICTEQEKNIGFNLMMGALQPVKSCIESEDKFMRAVLEMIASEVACTLDELDSYSKCTLLFTQKDLTDTQQCLLENTLDELKNFELIRIQNDSEVKKYVATSLGKACLSSSMAPNDGLSLFCELQKARQCLVLETDLHLIYLVTPYSVSSQWGDIDWLHLLTLWESLTRAMKRVGELVGVQESFIIRCVRGNNKMTTASNKMNIHKRFYTALALQDLVNEVPLYEVAAKFQCARGFLQSLQQAAATFAGMVTVFCHQLGWKNMEMLVSQFQDRLHFGIHSELLELMKLPSLNGLRARSLFNAGFETIASIASGEINAIENSLVKAVPFQSEKQREDDDSSDIRKRNKIKNVWITGNCGMTTREAAENLVYEARKYVEHELGVNDIKWNKENPNTDSIQATNSVSNDEFSQKLKHKTVDINAKQDTVDINTHGDPGTDIKVTENVNEIILEGENTISNKTVKIETENYPLEVVDTSDNKKPLNNKFESSNTNLNAIPHAINTKSPTLTKIKSQISMLKEEIVWDSLNFTENGFSNTSKSRISDQIFSPEMSFCDVEEKDKLETSQSSSLVSNSTKKDVSLFSFDGDNSSLFEDSLPLDLIPSKLLETSIDKINIKIKEPTDFTINTNSILNAFQSALDYNIDEDENIKLIYDDEKQVCSTPSNSSPTTENEQIINVFKKEQTLTNKRHIPVCTLLEPAVKKQKIDQPTLPVNVSEIKQAFTKINNNKSEQFTLNVGENKINCYILRETDVTSKIQKLFGIKKASLLLNVEAEEKLPVTDIIGCNVLKINPESHNKNKTNRSVIKTLTICLEADCVISFDLSIFDKSSTTFGKVLEWLTTDNLQLDVLSSKSIHSILRKNIGIQLSTLPFDISLAEWLINSDEKVPSLHYLAKKYCGIDLSAKKYKNSLTETCVNAWAIWKVAEVQRKCLKEQYAEDQRVLDLEIHVAKILANCEFDGLTVDKNLASQLLIDVKDSQEILQKNAYKICGHHFNFNSSKDVAKVLGIYKGHKVSTKKSVLTTHNTPLSSIVMYWRKLNSILTKTLYPLTEKAVIYSEGNRVNPAYTMFTCTGRICMHEPNLQNVPRTFSIPAQYLQESNEHCDDIIEFNCRNIFKASPGYVIVSADYCQLEMRILTHYSKDAVLTKIMCSDLDVFKAIAASWSCVAEDDVDDDLRQKAKQLCYGIIYGMGNKTLGQLLDVTEMEAAVFMDTFHRTYPAIKVFINSVIEECRKNGYIQTLMKRRRYLPDINSKIVSKKSSAERQAVNTTIQGSAADIAKAAMCEIDNRTDGLDDHNKPRLILQMHDELIYEVPEANKHNFVSILKHVMENTVRLNVPLPVKVKTGPSWGSLTDLKS